ncbi:hypothetical protein [Stackebrandtia nassauensis]|uniref:Uncharacterized protein n=1 Tax=Stackebrandtia nassauensis (strain DSM 44728 / CIP 108903 / NRRL B-16338 / NBRC 102104 / LLR-40K-21) TaxID=446470 RepID=D3PZH5_STANL|nr:hypothetical protein [Stackebrandtia nassauensis]ADD41649.1 hypothetical protein Snas_1953 [Stackebrandtia nassauensis DSM 44728]
MRDALIPIVIIAIFITGLTVSLTSYFKLLRTRASTPALDEYRKFAEKSLEQQAALRAELNSLTLRLSEVERLLRSVDEG